MALGLSGVSQAAPRDVVQTADGTITPSFLPKTLFRNVKLTTVVSVRDSEDDPACASSTPPVDGSCRIPPKASQAYVDFDRHVRFNQNSVAKCNPAAVSGQTTAQARNTCPRALVGFGEAIAKGGAIGGPTGPTYVTGVVTAFNSTEANSLILHLDLGGFSFNLNGRLVDSPLAGYGKRLSVLVPDTGTALTRFGVQVQRGRYVQARCRSASLPHKFRGLFVYGNGRGVDPDPPFGPWYPASAFGTSTSPCTVNPAPYKPCVRKARRAFQRKRRAAIRRFSGARRIRAIRRAKKQRRIAIRRCARLHLP